MEINFLPDTLMKVIIEQIFNRINFVAFCKICDIYRPKKELRHMAKNIIVGATVIEMKFCYLATHVWQNKFLKFFMHAVYADFNSFFWYNLAM